MSKAFSSDCVTGVLKRLFALSQREDPLAEERVSQREAELGRRLRQVLELVQSRLSRGSLVIADLSHDDPDLIPYLKHVRDPGGLYTSICLPLDAGVEVSALR